MSDVNQDIIHALLSAREYKSTIARVLKQSHDTAKFASRTFSELESQFNAIKIAAGDEHSEIYRLASLGHTMAQISADTVVMDVDDIVQELNQYGVSSAHKGSV